MQRKISSELLSGELELTASRSGGPGGQNVNKVSSKITLRWDVRASQVLTPEEKEHLLRKLATRLTAEGVLLLTAQESRSQLDNRELVREKLDQLLAKAFAKKKIRKATKPSKAAKQNRLQKKKRHADKKKWRQKPT